MKKCVLALACACGLLFGFTQSAQAAGGCPDGQYYAEYFDDRNLGDPPNVTRCESTVDNNWGLGSPVDGIPSDNWSAIWTSDFSSEEGNQTWTVTADDGVRVIIDGEVVLNEWHDQFATTYVVQRWLGRGRHYISVEYYERGGYAVAKILRGAVQSPSPPGQAAQYTSYFYTLGPGANLPSGADCASRVQRNSWEPRPSNNVQNRTTPGSYRVNRIDGADSRGQSQLAPRIDGNYTGTTDEIIRWASCKWGFDEDHIRAIAHTESSWFMSTAGDEGWSKGLIQIKSSVHDGTYPWSVDSTAFNLDYALAWKRACFEGYMSDWIPASSRGDEWGCTGLWCSGDWSWRDCGGYVGLVQYWVGNRPWLRYETR